MTKTTDELAGIVKGPVSNVEQQYKIQRDAQRETEAQIGNLTQSIQDLTSTHPQAAASSSSLSLPTIVLLEFTGKPDQSIELFIEQFEALLTSSGISPNQWVTYLKQQTQKDI